MHGLRSRSWRGRRTIRPWHPGDPGSRPPSPDRPRGARGPEPGGHLGHRTRSGRPSRPVRCGRSHRRSVPTRASSSDGAAARSIGCSIMGTPRWSVSPSSSSRDVDGKSPPRSPSRATASAGRSTSSRCTPAPGSRSWSRSRRASCHWRRRDGSSMRGRGWRPRWRRAGSTRDRGRPAGRSSCRKAVSRAVRSRPTMRSFVSPSPSAALPPAHGSSHQSRPRPASCLSACRRRLPDRPRLAAHRPGDWPQGSDSLCRRSSCTGMGRTIAGAHSPVMPGDPARLRPPASAAVARVATRPSSASIAGHPHPASGHATPERPSESHPP
jgi:hypothetical protein